MKPTSESVQWDCPECGCQSGTAFGSASFLCPACGCEALGDDLRVVYGSILRKLLRKPAFSAFARSPFPSDPVPESAQELLGNECPFLRLPAKWSDLSLLDVLWMFRAAPDAVAVLPLPTIKRAYWSKIENVTDEPAASFAAAIGTGKANDVSFLVRDGSATNLGRQERLLSAFGWSRWSEPERNKISHNLLDAVLRASGKQSIVDFSPETQLNLWRVDPDLSGIDPESLVPSFAPADFVFALGRRLLKPDALDSAFFNRWTPKDWLDLLRLPGLVLPKKAIIEINSRWNEFGWSASTLAELVTENPETKRAFPVLSSQTTADLLLKRPEFAGWMSDDGWLNRLSTQEWLRILPNGEILQRPEIQDYAKNHVLPGLSTEDRDRLIEANLDVAALYPPAVLPEQTVVDLYASGRHDDCFAEFDFMSLSRSGWLSLLHRCGKRIPSAASAFFLRDGVGLDTAAIESLLSSNPDLLTFFSEEQISHLSAKTFLRLCKETGAPDFLVSAYPLNALTHRTKCELLRAYPWIESHLDWKDWPIRHVAPLLHGNPMLERAWPRKWALFLWDNWKFLAKAVTLFTVGAALVILGLCIRPYLESSREKSIAMSREQEALAAKEHRLAREADARLAEANARATETARETAVATRDEQLSVERMQVAADNRAAEEARAQTAADNLAAEEARAQTAVDNRVAREAEARLAEAERDRQRSIERIRVAAANLAAREAEARRAEAERDAEAARRVQAQIEEGERRRVRELLQAAIRHIDNEDSEAARSELAKTPPLNLPDLEPDYKEVQSFVDYLDQALDGNADAAFRIGKIYLNPESTLIQKDARRAFQWIERAARRGSIAAMHSLGVLYKQGIGVSADESEAADWYRRAYEKGDWSAGVEYGRYLLKGGFRSPNPDRARPERAYRVFDKCAEEGNADALFYRGVCRMRGTGTAENRDSGWRDVRRARELGCKLQD